MPSTVICGCGAGFTRVSIFSHIRQSPNPQCHKHAAKSQEKLASNKKTRKEKRQNSPSSHSTPPPALYTEEHIDVDPTGDLFGNYASYLPQETENLEMGVSESQINVTNEDNEDEDAYELEVAGEGGLEPPRPVPEIQEPLPVPTPQEQTSGAQASAAMRLRGGAEEGLRKKPFIVPFPQKYGEAGKVYSQSDTNGSHNYGNQIGGDGVYGAFTSKLDWEVGKWAKLRGPSSTAFTELIEIEGIAELLGLSFRNTNELNKIIDSLPAQRPRFQRDEILIGGEVCEVYFRDIIACIKALYGDTEFAPYLAFAPERHYTDETMEVRLFHDMKTGKWWWSTQKDVEAHKPGATIVPIIISTDKTQLTLFRNKSAYPIYITIGTIPKEIRRKPSKRAYILLGYLPTSRLEGVTNQAARRRQLCNLYHACMKRVLRPLEQAGLDGVFMASGDGCTRRVHPILACFAGDYPEQVLATCTYTGQCPSCPTPHNNFGAYPPPDDPGIRDLEAILEALDSFEDDPGGFLQTCEAAGIKPVVEPFWSKLPYANIYRSITPDILHQLYQGIVKHVVGWITEAGGAAEIDARCRRMPPNHNIRHFAKGITSLSRVTGQEHDQMCRILLGVVVDLPLPGGLSNVRLVQCVRALLDFLYLAQLPIHTTETLAILEDALQRFHDNKNIFVDLGIRENFNLPKLHFALHYVDLIRLFGTTDNVNTEYTERLHIDFAKDAYEATSHKDEFSQMTLWLERKEKVLHHAQFVVWRQKGSPMPQAQEWTPPGLEFDRVQHLTKHPTLRSVHIDSLITDYGATHFRNALARYTVLTNNPNISRANLERALWGVRIPFVRVPVWHRLKFLRTDPATGVSSTSDAIHVRPARRDARGNDIAARFDTAWINDGDGGDVGVEGYMVGRVRVIFTIPEQYRAILFNNAIEIPDHLAYIQWFSALKDDPDPHHSLYSLTPLQEADGTHVASIIAVDDIRRSVHLFPRFGRVAPQEWSSSNDAEPFLKTRNLTDVKRNKLLSPESTVRLLPTSPAAKTQGILIRKQSHTSTNHSEIHDELFEMRCSNSRNII
ncbi:hypothetical protein CPB83DRAFT_924972 [Crepidotus variabilis]|uniref:Uncharacterized protein n=1 Tax=Crepidotus variabilis TaxID=179855 RepID=A0A9P6EIQ2_9AGAR|nr:hypothetical protein CPB83DRAFT_924972 [Crepidotus variabilis]